MRTARRKQREGAGRYNRGCMGRLLNSEALRQPGKSCAGSDGARLPSAQHSARYPGATTLSRSPTPPVPSQAYAPVTARVDHAEQTVPNALQRLGFLAGLAILFVKITVLPELLVAFLHVNTYLLWVVSPPALFAALFAGGIGRTLRFPAGRWFFAFFCWVGISLPFSSWVGGSVPEFRFYAQNSFVLMFVVAGLTLVWNEVRSTFLTIGAAGIFIILAARFLALGDSGRLEMRSTTGTIGNENDLASHLIFVLPFVLFIAMDQRINRVFRFLMVLPIGYGLYIIFATASRGGLLSLVVCFLFLMIRGSSGQRMAALAAGLMLAVSIPILLSGTNALERLGSLFGGAHEEAKESADARNYLLRQSINYSFTHPLFGVGYTEFGNYEGKTSVQSGVTGNWHETHNAFTQVSSECGLPALLFFVLAIGSSMASVDRIYRRARREGYAEIANASFCFLLSMVGYTTSIVFLSNAYRYYLPIMIGLAIALTATATQAMSLSQPANVPVSPAWNPPIRARLRVPQPQH
jgi:O-antigen ligase